MVCCLGSKYGLEWSLASRASDYSKQDSLLLTQEWKAIFQPEKTEEEYVADEMRLLAEATAEDDAAA
eukprot:6485380-Amphidinium_carterae.2